MFKFRFLRVITLVALIFSASSLNAQQYRHIFGWSDEINEQIEGYLNTTISMDCRKVAVFDGDGTVLGQVPYYLADEALYRYADLYYKGKNDKLSKEKMQVIDNMLSRKDNVCKEYVEDRVHFLAGMTPEEIENLGYACYLETYQGKFYPEMKQFIANLKEYDFEVWIITASPEMLYQKILSVELGIPTTNIIGVKSVVEEGKSTSKIILPIPQDDGKANTIPTYIKTTPLIVGGNSRGDMDMINESIGLKMIVNPDSQTVRGKDDGPMAGETVKSYWEKEGALIVQCKDVSDGKTEYHTANWKGIKKNVENPKTDK